MQRFCNEPKEINDGDRHHSGALCPCRSDFAKRFDRCRMGGAGAVLSAALARGASAQMADASNCRGDPVSAARGPAVADAAALLPAGDRKSVVSGTSVSVRVDLGGLRLLKQKKTPKS